VIDELPTVHRVFEAIFSRKSGADVAAEHRKSKRGSALCVSGIGKFLESLIVKISLAAPSGTGF
jgi:hypothetical protein